MQLEPILTLGGTIPMRFYIQLCAAVVCLVVLTGLTGSSLPSQGVPPYCAPDSSTEAVVSYVRELVVRDDAHGVVFRQPWSLPQMDSTLVSAVNVDAVCHAASQAYNRELGRPDPLAQVSVVQAGTRFIVRDPAENAASEWSITLVFSDSTFSQRIARVLF
jgi:hypothetical protein